MNNLRQATADTIIGIVHEEWNFLSALPQEATTISPGEKRWNIRQIVGHLIDSAANNHQRMVRLQYQKVLDFPDYTAQNEFWVAIQAYRQEHWLDMLSLWKHYNLHIAHLISYIDTDCLSHVWHDGKGQSVTLEMMMLGYSEHLRAHLRDVHALVEAAQ